MNELTWQDAPPDRAGWWWIEFSSECVSIVRVFHDPNRCGRVLFNYGGTAWEVMGLRNVRWAGPIPDPGE